MDAVPGAVPIVPGSRVASAVSCVAVVPGGGWSTLRRNLLRIPEGPRESRRRGCCPADRSRARGAGIATRRRDSPDCRRASFAVRRTCAHPPTRTRSSVPPARVNSATAAWVFAPAGHGLLRNTIKCRPGTPELNPAAVHAFWSRFVDATALGGAVIARNAHCTCVSVSSSRVRRKRACRAGFVPGGTSCW